MFREPDHMQTGTPPGVNHPIAYRLRDGQMDTWAYNLHYRSNPDILAEEMYKQTPHGISFADFQGYYHQMRQTSQEKRELELFGTAMKAVKNYLREDVSLEHAPTFVHGSDWYKQAVEANYRATGNERLLPNNIRSYNY